MLKNLLVLSYMNHNPLNNNKHHYFLLSLYSKLHVVYGAVEYVTHETITVKAFEPYGVSPFHKQQPLLECWL